MDMLVRVYTCATHGMNVEAGGQLCGVGLPFMWVLGDGSPVVAEPPHRPAFVRLFDFVWF